MSAPSTAPPPASPMPTVAPPPGNLPVPSPPPTGQPAGGGRRGGREILDIATSVAGTLRALQEWWPVLPELDDLHRTSVLLERTDEFDVWLLRWPFGTHVDPHDHGDSAAAISVVSGELLEVRWLGGTRRTRRLDPSSAVTVAPGVVHDVVGATDAALSVHVYSPPLSTMGFYDESGTKLLRVDPVEHQAPVEHQPPVEHRAPGGHGTPDENGTPERRSP